MNRRTMLQTSMNAALMSASARLFGLQSPVSTVRSVAEFGATGDGVTSCTLAIQRAIDAVAAAGGGTVGVPAGSYVTGSLRLKSHVTLHLAAGASLLGSLNPEDYTAVDPFLDAVNVMRGFALIAADGATDVGLSGEGVIDGRGVELQRHGSGADAKPFLVRWVRCAGVQVSGLTLRNASAWTMHAFQSTDVVYSKLRIFSFGVENNDGLDIDSCERVTIDDCLVESQDDAICIKTTSVKPCRKVKVSNCTIRTHHGALKIGTESMGDIEDIEFSGCHVIDAREGAIKFCSEDGANVRRVLVSNLLVDMVDTPIFLRLGGRMRKYRKDDPTLPIGSISGITLRDIHVADATRVGILVSGIRGYWVEDLTLANIFIKLKGEINQSTEGDIVLEEQVVDYPEVWMFGPLIPAYGAYLRHARRVSIREVELKVELPDRRPALVCDDVVRLSVAALRLTGAPRSSWVATLRNCVDIALKQITPISSARTLLRVQGARSERIQLEDTFVSPGMQAVELQEGAQARSVMVSRP